MMGLFSKVKELTERYEDVNEAALAWKQAAEEAQGKVERMTKATDPITLSKIAHDLAERIEDLFAVGGMTRIQRLQNLSTMIYKAMWANQTGEE